MAEESRVFIGLLRPPKLMGLPIMYAMVWLFGSTLLFLWIQSWTVVVVAGALPGNCPAAQRGHRQDWRRWASGMAASASGAISAPMHQQLSGARPAVMAHWLLWPHSGQRSGSTGTGAAVEGAEKAMAPSVGRCAVVWWHRAMGARAK